MDNFKEWLEYRESFTQLATDFGPYLTDEGEKYVKQITKLGKKGLVDYLTSFPLVGKCAFMLVLAGMQFLKNPSANAQQVLFCLKEFVGAATMTGIPLPAVGAFLGNITGAGEGIGFVLGKAVGYIYLSLKVWADTNVDNPTAKKIKMIMPQTKIKNA